MKRITVPVALVLALLLISCTSLAQETKTEDNASQLLHPAYISAGDDIPLVSSSSVLTSAKSGRNASYEQVSFSLTDANGTIYTPASFANTPYLLFYGRPICPNTMAFVHAIAPHAAKLRENGIAVICCMEPETTTHGDLVSLNADYPGIIFTTGSLNSMWAQIYDMGNTEYSITFPVTIWHKADGRAYDYSIGYVNDVAGMVDKMMMEKPENPIPAATPAPTPAPTDEPTAAPTKKPSPTAFYPGLTKGEDGNYYYMVNGEIKSDNGLTLVGNEFYLLSWGKLLMKTTLVNYDNAWFYVVDGRFDPTANGIVDYDGSKFFVSAGQIRYDYSGLFQNAGSVMMSPDNQWYFIANGQIQTQYTGLAQYDGHWFYLVNGVLAENFSGTVEYNGSVFNVKNGMVV